MNMPIEPEGKKKRKDTTLDRQTVLYLDEDMTGFINVGFPKKKDKRPVNISFLHVLISQDVLVISKNGSGYRAKIFKCTLLIQNLKHRGIR